MNTKFFALAAFALSLAACTNDNEAIDNGPVAARINAEISNTVTTRARPAPAARSGPRTTR